MFVLPWEDCPLPVGAARFGIISAALNLGIDATRHQSHGIEKDSAEDRAYSALKSREVETPSSRARSSTAFFNLN